MKTALFGTIAVAAVLAASTAGAVESTRYLLEPAAVWSAGDAGPHAGWVVAVEGDKITGVGPKGSVKAGPGAVTVALPGLTLTPGLIELHSHLLLHAYNEVVWDDQVLEGAASRPGAARRPRRHPHPDERLHHRARPGHRRARPTPTCSLKRAIEEGIVAGPRLFVADPRHRRHRLRRSLKQGGFRADSGAAALVRPGRPAARPR